MNFYSVAAVALGGALGAAARYILTLIPFKCELPLATLIANLIGALAIGFIAGAVSVRGGNLGNKNFVLFCKTGICGGFTTFSTFSLESVGLIEGGKYGIAAAYIAVSLFGCLLGVFAGSSLAKALLR